MILPGGYHAQAGDWVGDDVGVGVTEGVGDAVGLVVDVAVEGIVGVPVYSTSGFKLSGVIAAGVCRIIGSRVNASTWSRLEQPVMSRIIIEIKPRNLYLENLKYFHVCPDKTTKIGCRTREIAAAGVELSIGNAICETPSSQSQSVSNNKWNIVVDGSITKLQLDLVGNYIPEITNKLVDSGKYSDLDHFTCGKTCCIRRHAKHAICPHQAENQVAFAENWIHMVPIGHGEQPGSNPIFTPGLRWYIGRQAGEKLWMKTNGG